MSQRAVLRGFFLCILAVLAAAARRGADLRDDHFSPSHGDLRGRGNVSLITAQIVFPVGAGLPGGLQTSRCWLGAMERRSGSSTVPSTITYTTAPGQTSATVSFRLAAAPFAWPSSRRCRSPTARTPGYGLLNVDHPAALGRAVSADGRWPASTSASLDGDDRLHPYLRAPGPSSWCSPGSPGGLAGSLAGDVHSRSGQRARSYGQVSFRIAASPSTPAGTYDGERPDDSGSDRDGHIHPHRRALRSPRAPWASCAREGLRRTPAPEARRCRTP